jgi:molybdate transport system permease protein
MEPADWQIIWFTVAMAFASTVTVTPVAIGLGWLLARKHWIGKSFLETIISLPLVMPPVATGLILLKLFGRRGPIGAFLHEALGTNFVFTWKAVWIALVVMSFPLMVRTIRVAFEQVNPRLEQVGRTLGAGPWRAFSEITLPLAFRGIVGAMVLGFARALGEFGATIMVAGAIPGKTETMAVAIFNFIQLGEDSSAMKLLAVSIIFSFIALWASEWFLRKSKA